MRRREAAAARLGLDSAGSGTASTQLDRELHLGHRGKLDVREAAARLPDEGEESGALDEAETMIDVEGDGAEDLGAASEEAEA